MQYSRLGNTGLIVSRLSFGVMTFGAGGPAEDSTSAVWKTPQNDANRLIDRAIDSGINFFDAADAYAGGQSEEMLGRALGSRRKDVIISTKVGFRSGDAVVHAGGSMRHILEAAESSLRRLNTDYIDLFSIHKPDPFTPYEETARALENLVDRGLVRYVGYSNLSAWQAAKFIGIQRQHNYSPFTAAQMYYSLLGRDLEYEVAPFCEDAGIGIVVWSPLAGGFLTGRYTREDPTGGKGRLSSFDLLPHDKEKSYDLIDRMKDIGHRYKASVAQVALAWLLSRKFVTTILLGASKMSQLEDNLGATDVQIAAEDMAELDRLTDPPPIYPNWFHKFALDSTASEALSIGLHSKPTEVKV